MDYGQKCICGCGRSALTESGYHSDCRVACKCGCGARARYAYAPGHRPTVTCPRCAKVFDKVRNSDRETDHCAACARHLAAGGPVVKNMALADARAMQKAAPAGRRWCCGCQRYRLAKFFVLHADGYQSRCKPCAKEQAHASRVAKKFNITIEQYRAIKDVQGGKCFVCQIATGASQNLSVDHDHSCCPASGESCGRCVRGLLCSRCNVMIGFARDQPWMFHRAVTYLAHPPAFEVLGDAQ